MENAPGIIGFGQQKKSESLLRGRLVDSAEKRRVRSRNNHCCTHKVQIEIDVQASFIVSIEHGIGDPSTSHADT